MMFRHKPILPIMRTMIGSSTSTHHRDSAHVSLPRLNWRSFELGEYSHLSSMKRSIDCRKMLIPSAKRNTPLKKPPRSWPRCHPKEKALGVVLRSEICVIDGVRPHIFEFWWVPRELTNRAANATENPMRSFSCCVLITAGLALGLRERTDVVEGICNEG